MANPDLSNPAEVVATPHQRALAKAKARTMGSLPEKARYTLLQTVMVGPKRHDAGETLEFTRDQAMPLFPEAIELAS